MNKRIILIEGKDIDPGELRVLFAEDYGVEVHFVDRGDDMAPEPVKTAVEPEWVEELSLSIEMARWLNMFKHNTALYVKQVTSAIDKRHPDVEVAIENLRSLERLVSDVRQRMEDAEAGRDGTGRYLKLAQGSSV